MADIKVRLKRVKELIDTQEWQKAFDITERILSEDPLNTHARLFMGKTAMELDKPDHAIECFRSVAKSQPDQVAAWQGVIVFYGKYKQVQEASDELLEAYKRCLEHLGDDDKIKPKIIEYLLGYSRQMNLKGSTDGLQPVLERLIRLSTGGHAFKDARVEGRQRLIRLLLPKKYETDLATFSPDQLDLILTTFEELLSEFDQSNLDQNYPQEHLNVLLRLDKIAEADRFSRSYMERFDAQFAFAATFMAVLKKSLKNGSIIPGDEADWAVQDKLAAIELQHPLVRIGKAFQAFLKKDFKKSADLLEKALSEGKGLPSLSPAYKVPYMDDIEWFSRKFLGISWICLGDSESLRKGVEMLKRLSEKGILDWEVVFYVGFAQVEFGDVEKARETLKIGYEALGGVQEMKVLLGALEAFIVLQEKDFDVAEVLSENALILVENNHLFHYIFFRSLWDNRRRDPRRCISHLYRSIEVFSGYAIPHLYLGFYVWRENSNVEAAVAEFELAYKLLPRDARVIRAYTDFCTLDHRDEKAIEILRLSLQSAATSTENGRWMRLRLALLCYRNKLWHECISSLRSILRSFPDDRLVQEFLADALTFRGNYFSAAAMFQDVLTATPADDHSPEYSLYRLATIRQKLKLDEEAESDFERLLKQSSSFRGMCLISLAEIELRKAKLAFKSSFPLTGVECCQKAVDFLSQAIPLTQTSPVIWSLLGDACLLMRYVRPGKTMLLIDHTLWDGSDQHGKIALNIRQVLYLATVFYGVAIDLRRTSCRLWERLAVAYFFLAKRVESAGELVAGKNWMKRSLLALREMLQRNPWNPWVWHTAGFILSGSNLTAEVDACRMYTKAVELFRHFDLNPTVVAATWTALGFVYVNKRRFVAGNALLRKGQDADPKLPEPWMGQAWCAERLGHALEGMDLTRHASSLGLAKPAMRRYGEWVVWLCLKPVEHVDSHLRWAILNRLTSVPTAINHLMQYLQLCEEDVSVAMVLSLLLEWNGLTRSALDWARKALAMIESSESRFEPTGTELWDKARLNLARLLCETGQFEESLAMLGTIETDPSLGMVLLLAVEHFRLKNFDDALAMLNVALSMSEDETANSAIQLAVVVVHFYAGQSDEAASLCRQLLLDDSLSASVGLRAKLALSVVELKEDSTSLTEVWNGFLLDCSRVRFPLEDEESRRERLQRTISSGSSDSQTSSHLIHLQPTRIDFRLASLFESPQTPTNGSFLDQNHSFHEIFKELLPLADHAPPLKEFWQVLVETVQMEPVHDETLNSVVQKAVHLYPYETAWWKTLG